MMMKNKRRMGVHEKQRPCKKVIRPNGTSSARSDSSREPSPGALSQLSEQVVSRLCRSVVSLASFHVWAFYFSSVGDTKLGECTGICIETSCPDATSFLTSRLLIPLTWPTREITENLTIEVHLPNGRTVTGWIEHPGRYVDFLIVNVKDLSVFDVARVSLDCDMQFEPYRKVAAVWRNFSSGLLGATSGVDLASLSALTSETMFSTCQINKAGIGGPLVDFDGNFVGMNCSRTRRKKTPYVRREQILQFLEYYRMVSVRAKEETDDAEEPGIESEMKQLLCSIPGGSTKFFACTGVFVKCNACSATILTSASLVRVSGDAHRIDDNLRIEVCLPNEFRVVGILNRYNLHYNVGLVDIMGYWGPREIQISRHQVTSCNKVIAVGRLFTYHNIMAAKGKLLAGKRSKLDCIELCVSTCKTTKAGIGGPLIDTGGNFLGMNFYHEEETPFLPRDVIHRLLLNLNKGWTRAGDTIVEGDEKRCLLPGPCWSHGDADTIAEGGVNKWPLPEPYVRPADIPEPTTLDFYKLIRMHCAF
ncbi:hypothetical protein CFC21_073134 [Triticum aestivum]|uniref:Uncharacterized protein n=3 Tax=Triticum TaxID=4564 RepID=A0A9R0XF29_TRITD|nr:hypothetical protein CFC21_073134 [Triticum aestivum]VAI35588.1 unnamed protein product [Triticum turgidum subsp. durum]